MKFDILNKGRIKKNCVHQKTVMKMNPLYRYTLYYMNIQCVHYKKVTTKNN